MPDSSASLLEVSIRFVLVKSPLVTRVFVIVSCGAAVSMPNAHEHSAVLPSWVALYIRTHFSPSLHSASVMSTGIVWPHTWLCHAAVTGSFLSAMLWTLYSHVIHGMLSSVVPALSWKYLSLAQTLIENLFVYFQYL